MAQETDNGWPSKSLFLDPHVQFSFWRDGTDRREMVPTQGHTQGRGLSFGGISAHRRSQQVKSRLIYKNYRPFFALCFFLRADHVSSRQRAMAVSSRWLARSTGFWRLHPTFFSKRPTWTGVYITPNSRLMTVATRPRVQTAPRKPKCSAPWLNNVGNWLNCALLKRGFGPPPRRLDNASAPPSRPFRNHWLTAPSLTPKAAAMSFCFQPVCFNSQARKRRASRQSFGRLFSFSFMRLVYTKPHLFFSKLCPHQ